VHFPKRNAVVDLHPLIARTANNQPLNGCKSLKALAGAA
jgi:hypothetical protein